MCSLPHRLCAIGCRFLGIPLLVAAVMTASPAAASDASPAPTSAPTTSPGKPVARDKPRSSDRRTERDDMVRRQIAARGVRDPAVLEALRNVPRHWFIPQEVQRHAYADRPLPIGHGQTISQPYIVALMTEALKIDAESKVLEVGTGSGYQAAVLAELTPHVFTIEIVKPLGARAIRTFKERGYETIQARIGDGYRGWPEHAPFDAVIVTCAPDHIPQPLLEQLAPGGRICIPVGAERGVQELVLATKQADGSLKRETLSAVRFVPMTGTARSRDPERD